MNIPEWTFYNNAFHAWLTALVVFVLTLALLRVVKGVINRRISEFATRTKTTIDDLVSDLLAKTKIFFMLAIAVYSASLSLVLPLQISFAIQSIVIISVLLQAAIWGNRLVSYLISQYVSLEIEDEAAPVASTAALTFIGRLILWSLLILVGLDNLGVDVTALVASLGIGGIAVALAVQNILGDLFASLSIMLDKPFVVGDFITVSEHSGAVEYIGLKTTRIRSLSGEQLIFSNSDLLGSRIRNFKRMSERRAVFSFGVTYQTSHQKLETIPKMVQEIVESQELARFDRAHFKEYGDSSLNFEVVYWVKVPDMKQYLDIQQNINLDLFQRFEKEEIEFAYPTQTLFVTQETSAS
jgi:small-conductance mechanosensitive channel